MAKKSELNEQRILNERAIKIGAKITRAPRYDIKFSDGTHYSVDTRPELYALITNLEKQHDAG
jgi:hypothetical protein